MLTLLIIPLSRNEPFYEDSMYINKAISILDDGDYNLLNQVPLSYTRIITKEFAFPSPHSNVMTGGLIASNFIFKSFSLSTNSHRLFFAALFLHILSMLWGASNCHRAFKLLGENIPQSAFLVFVVTSPMVYFGLVYFSLMGIFLFPFTAYLFYIITQLEFSEEKLKSSGWVLGVGAGLMLYSRISYIVAVLAALIVIIGKRHKVERRFWISAVMSFSIVAISQTMDAIMLFGEYMNLNGVASEFFDISVRNITKSLFYGFWGLGGVFFSGPLYLLIFIAGIKLLYEKARTRYLYTLFCLLWVSSVFMQTIPLSTTVYEDHLVGRFSLMVLPILYLGFAYIWNRLTPVRRFFLFSSISIYQFVMTLNFKVQYSKGQYLYQKERLVKSWSEISAELSEILFHAFDYSIYDLVTIFLFVFFSTMILILCLRYKKAMKYYSISTAFGLLSLSVVNYKNTEDNTVKNIKNGLVKDRVIGEGKHIYMLNLVFDGMNSFSIGSEDPILRDRMEEKREIFYQKAEKEVARAPEWFWKKMKKRDFSFVPFLEREEDELTD